MIMYYRLEELANACLHYIVMQEGDLEELCFHQSIEFTKEELDEFGLTEKDATGYIKEQNNDKVHSIQKHQWKRKKGY